jgi:hypothetical protein
MPVGCKSLPRDNLLEIHRWWLVLQVSNPPARACQKQAHEPTTGPHADRDLVQDAHSHTAYGKAALNRKSSKSRTSWLATNTGRVQADGIRRFSSPSLKPVASHPLLCMRTLPHAPPLPPANQRKAPAFPRNLVTSQPTSDFLPPGTCFPSTLGIHYTHSTVTSHSGNPRGMLFAVDRLRFNFSLCLSRSEIPTTNLTNPEHLEALAPSG